jgi:type I restriction enzyme, S subunit
MSWPNRKLVEICSFKTGKLDSNAAVANGEFPFFTCAQETYRIDKAAFDTEAVLLGGNNAAGIFPLKYYEGLFNAYQRTYIIESLDKNILSTRFLYFSLIRALTHFQSVSIGAATQYLTKPILDNFSITLPTIAIQNTIVNVLSAYDDLIENNRCRIALLEESARLLYQEWFVHLRFPGYEHTRIIDGVPEEWIRVPFDQALTLQRGFDLPTQARQDGDIPIYGSTGIVGFHSLAKVSGPGVITGRSGTLGTVHYVMEDYWPLNTALWVKEFKMVSPLFALFLLRELDLKQFNGGVSVPTLDRKTIHKLDILVPSKQLLSDFTDFAQDIFCQIKNLTLQNQKLSTARDLLLPRLMNGEISV